MKNLISNVISENRPMLTRKQVAARCGVHVETIKRWGRAGLLPVHRINSRLTRYESADVEKFLAESRTQRAA
jgi:excisionase family DNA binding protein